MSQKITSLFSALAVIGGLFAASGLAFAQMESSVLFVAPHRVIMDPSEKVEVLNVANKSEKTHRYDLTLIDQVMNERGMTLRQDTFEYSAKRMIRFVPKRFTLKPGERQVVRVMVKRPEGLADGDYHSHLLFREVPLSVQDKQALKDERSAENKEKSVTFEIRALYGVAVPIIVQQGKVESDISLGDVRLIPAGDKTLPALEIDFARTGNAEAASQVSASFVKDGGKPVELLGPTWVRIYREVSKVTRRIELKNIPSDVTLSGGKIVLSLTKGGDKEEAAAPAPAPSADGKPAPVAAETQNVITKEIQVP